MAKKISSSVGKGGKNHVIDPLGNLTSDASVSMDTGNPAPSAVLSFSAPASSSPQTVVIAYPIGGDSEFMYDPAELGPVESLDFALDLLPTTINGTPQVHVSLAILQDEAFVAMPTPGTPSMDEQSSLWIRVSQPHLEAADFIAADGGPERPDFSRPFEFGYAFIADYAAAPLEVELQLDNMEATVNIVPEPSLLGFVIVLAVPLLWLRRFRKPGPVFSTVPDGTAPPTPSGETP